MVPTSKTIKIVSGDRPKTTLYLQLYSCNHYPEAYMLSNLPFFSRHKTNNNAHQNFRYWAFTCISEVEI